MPTRERSARRRERDRLDLVGRAMQERRAHADLVMIDEHGRFVFRPAYIECFRCRGPMLELPVPNRRFGNLPCCYCPFCDFARFVDAVNTAAGMVDYFEGEMTDS